jgi:primosomal protein N' (replication factor Y) (superfamily II helicase)
MYFYLIWVRSSRYHGSEPLTYSSSENLKVGSIVQVELQKDTVMGLIVGTAGQPRFKTKPIVHAYPLPALPLHLIKLSQWLQAYYPAPLGIIGQQLLPAQLATKQITSPPQQQFSAPDLTTLPPLTAEQQAALIAIAAPETYLLHGKTGSGKTRLYIELAARAVASGKSAIILTPEISLTSQLANNFRAVFGDRVLVLHSQQAPSERQRAWLDSLQADQPVIVIGPRSALFSPIARLGLIVLDESHEAAYKQDQAPQYQTNRVAARLAQLTRSTLVLGSATPAINDYFLAARKNKPIINLFQLAQGEHPASRVTLVDMKDRALFPRSSYLSQPLINSVRQALARGEQSLLYLNRRGTARLVMCESCGWQATCPHCDIPLTYHGDKHELRCHSCDYHDSLPTNCPVCAHPSILFKTAGTKAIVDEVTKLFPNARTARFDTDNNRAERFEQHYEAVRRGDVDILIGTQLLAKGLDLPKLSTLGVLLADTSLYMPDFSAQERTFQLISQVLGRIGRGHVAGTAIIQTYHTDHPILAAAIAGDYLGFYESELKTRHQFLFPPYCYLLKLTCRRATSRAAELAATKLKHTIQTGGFKVRVEGPAPSFYEKFQAKFQWQLVVKAVDRPELIKIIAALPTSGWSFDIDPNDLL